MLGGKARLVTVLLVAAAIAGTIAFGHDWLATFNHGW